MEIKQINIVKKEYNGIDYYRIKFLDQESQFYSRREVNDIIEYWQKDQLFGSFAIGYKLAKNAVITWE